MHGVWEKKVLIKNLYKPLLSLIELKKIKDTVSVYRT